MEVTIPKCPFEEMSSLSEAVASNLRTCFLRKLPLAFFVLPDVADAVRVKKLPCSSPITSDSDSGATAKHATDPPGIWIDSTGSRRLDIDQKLSLPSEELVTNPAYDGHTAIFFEREKGEIETVRKVRAP